MDTIPILALIVLIAHGHRCQDGFASMHGGTIGGLGGEIVYVSNDTELRDAVRNETARIIKITTLIKPIRKIQVFSNKSILGANRNAGLTGFGFQISNRNNVVVRGLRFAQITSGDAITVTNSTRVWIDHNEFVNDLQRGKDGFDGLVDINNGSDYVTLSWNKFHEHHKVSLVGSNDAQSSMDNGKLHVTYHHNYFRNVGSRVPSIRFGTGHVYNNLYENVETSGVHARMGAQLLVESNVFNNVSTPMLTHLDSIQDGFIVDRNNKFGLVRWVNATQAGTFSKAPYRYILTPVRHVELMVKSRAGQSLSF